MRVAHFIHRYPRAIGGAEAYFARLSSYLAQQGDRVTVFTTTALDLRRMEAFSETGFPAPAATIRRQLDRRQNYGVEGLDCPYKNEAVAVCRLQ